MKKQNIIVDFDDTLVVSRPYVIDYVNETWGINTVTADYLECNDILKIVRKYKRDESISYDQVYGDYNNNFALSLFWHEKLMPMPDMCEILPKLAMKYNVHVATKRNQKGIHLVKMVLDKYIPKTVSSIYCATKEIESGVFLHTTKKDFILGLDGESIALIDDSRHEVEEAKGIIQSYLFDPIYCNGAIDGVIVVRSWKEIGKLFLNGSN